MLFYKLVFEKCEYFHTYKDFLAAVKQYDLKSRYTREYTLSKVEIDCTRDGIVAILNGRPIQEKVICQLQILPNGHVRPIMETMAWKRIPLQRPTR